MRLKVLAGSLVTFSLLLFGGVFLAHRLDLEAQMAHLVPNSLMPLQRSVSSLRLAMSEQRIRLMMIMKTGDQRHIEAFSSAVSEIDGILADATDLLNGLRAVAVRPESVLTEPSDVAHIEQLVAQLAEIVAVCENCIEMCQRIIAGIGTGSGDAAGPSMMETLQQRVAELGAMTGEFVISVDELAADLATRASAMRAGTLEAFRILIALAVGLGIAGNIYLFVALGPIRRLANAVRRIAAGEYDVRIEEAGSSELLLLTREFNAMSEALVRHRQELAESQRRLLERETLSQVGEIALGIAHEVRNAMSTVNMTLQAMARRENLSPHDRERIGLSEAELQRMSRMVTALLRYGRPTAPRPELLDVVDELEKIGRLMAPTFEASGVRFELRFEFSNANVRPLGHIDPDHLSQIVTNLLLNAAQVSASGQVVRVDIAGDAVHTVISVSDNGAGIPAEEIDLVTTPFFTRRHGGTGLGLTIARRLADVNDAKLEIASVVGDGTVVRLRLSATGPRAGDPLGSTPARSAA